MKRKYNCPTMFNRRFVASTDWSDAKRLWFINKMLEASGPKYSTLVKNRRAFHLSIKENQENGFVAIVFSGMDCDCVKYSGDVRIVKADWRVVDEYIDEECKWADGPVYWRIDKPSVAEAVKYESRDLALEAFENGHQHVVYP